jgi:hypothetical protein
LINSIEENKRQTECLEKEKLKNAKRNSRRQFQNVRNWWSEYCLYIAGRNTSWTITWKIAQHYLLKVHYIQMPSDLAITLKRNSGLRTLEDKNVHYSQVTVAHACNPSYLGDRDQEDLGLKSAQANSS